MTVSGRAPGRQGGLTEEVEVAKVEVDGAGVVAVVVRAEVGMVQAVAVAGDEAGEEGVVRGCARLEQGAGEDGRGEAEGADVGPGEVGKDGGEDAGRAEESWKGGRAGR